MFVTRFSPEIISDCSDIDGAGQARRTIEDLGKKKARPLSGAG